jgi:hypothetical protein
VRREEVPDGRARNAGAEDEEVGGGGGHGRILT